MATYDGSFIYSEQSEAKTVDMSHEYTCFLCNGFQTVIGTISLDSTGITLTNAIGMVLEYDTFEEITSVNELDPVNPHSLIVVFPQRYVMLSYLLRKTKLIDVFKDIGLYQEEPKIPPEAIGFYDPALLGSREERSDPINHEDDDVMIDHREKDRWSNKEEQDRYVQKQIRKQSVLNNVQVLSSRNQELKKAATGDWMQLERYPSTMEQNKKETKTHRRQHTAPQLSSPVSTATVTGSNDKLAEKLEQLKTILPNHSHESLLSSLKVCDYSVDDTIDYILNKDEICNT